MDNLRKSFLVKGNSIVGAIGDKYYSTSPIGVIQAYSGNTAPNGYLLCDGASYKVADYPDLYAVIGNTYGGDTENFNVPDYRETVLVGVGENTTDTIASHDVYGLGEFKDDQLQIITGTANIWGYHGALNPTGAFGQDGITEPTYSAAETAMGSKLTFNSSNVTRSSSSTNVTHGKQKGVTYIIKAFHTNEGVDSGVSDDVINYVETELVDLGGREQSVTFPFTPTVNGTLILTIGQKSVNPISRAVNVIYNGEPFYHVNNYFGTSWGASSTSIPLFKGKTYTVDDPDDAIMYEKTKFIY